MSLDVVSHLRRRSRDTDRRCYVRTLALPGATGAYGGCTGRSLPGDGETQPTANKVVDQSLRLGRGDLEAAEDDPSVRFEPSADRVVAEGVIVVGPGFCEEVGVGGVQYDHGVLSVTVRFGYVEAEKDEDTHVCTIDVIMKSYELAVTFDDGLPDRVVAEERDGRGKTRRTVRER